MSKRFGRNQKRRMRQQIEQLEKDLHNHKCWMYQERQLNARNREIVAETAQVLGHYFMTLDPMEQEVRDLDALIHGWRVHFPGRLDCADAATGYEQQQQRARFMEVVLPVLYGSVFADKLGQHIHIRFTYAGHDVGYAIRLESLRMLPHDVAVRRISQEMARFLYKELGKPVELAR